MMRTIGISVATVALNAVAIAQITSPFNTNECLERTGVVWCPSKAKADGWILKYTANSSREMMDFGWHIEVWTRGKVAMLCQSSGGRAGHSSRCQELHEAEE